MKKVIVLGIMMCFFAFAKAFATPSVLQEFVSHQVKDGETVYSISKAYGVSEKEIYKLNPDAKSSVYEGLVLILPSTTQSVANPVGGNGDDLKFKTHKVKRKETLYSISRNYNVPEDVLKKHNKQLYSQTLRKGDKIKIPTNYKNNTDGPVGISVITPPKDDNDTTAVVKNVSESIDYTVQAKETKYGIARKYGITIAQLEQMNPGMGAGLKEGATIQVPNIKTEKQAVIDQAQYSFYEVKKGNTMYSLLREFNLKADDLLALNPALDDGLKEGMILKVPKGSAGAISTQNTQVSINQNAGKVSLADSITDYSVKNIAIMLPFGLKRATADTADVRKNMLKRDRVLRLALDFHSGVLMAVKDAEKIGINSNVTVYDTDYVRKDGSATNARKVENIINSNDFSNTDAVIGPMLGFNVDRAASLLLTKGIPVVSPLTQRISGGLNVFQTRPSDELLRAKMMDYLETLSKDNNVIIIADTKNSGAKSKLKALFPNAKEVAPRKGDNGMFLYGDDITAKISDTKPNIVIVETNDIPLISNVTTKLNTLRSSEVEGETMIKRDINLFTTFRGTAYDSDEIQHTHLMNLNFHFPSMEKEYDETSSAFIEAYETKYNITPSTEAIRGYDIMMDTLLRLGYAQDLFQSVSSGLETQYVENKFQYAKSSKGFYNTAAYIMKYEENLLLKEVEVIPAKDE